MDVLKKQWKTIVLYQFWILSTLVLISSALVFFLSSGSLSALIAKRSSALKASVEQINGIKNAASTHPNTFSHVQMDKAVAELQTDIIRAWEFQFKRQEPLMKWPRAAFYADTTHEIFSTLRPVEKFIDFPLPPRLPAPYDRITKNDREIYKNYIGPEFAEVSKIIGTEWLAKLSTTNAASAYGSGDGMGSGMSGGSKGMSGAGMGGMEGSSGGGYGGSGIATTASASKDLVRWPVTSQQTLLQNVVPWYSKMQPPSILDIYYTQEDMWLLTGIMEIIKKANGGARENFQTVVREVEWIRMGKHASRSAGVLTRAASAAGASMYGGMEGGDSDGGMGGMGGKGMGGMPEMENSGEGGSMGDMYGGKMGGDGAEATPIDPADGRYISFAAESVFQPRKGEELRTAIREVSSSNAVDAVVKRVPIRMRLKVDPSRLSRLISACGSAELRLEVYQVRWNTDPAPAVGLGGGGMSGYDGGGGSKGAMGSGMGMPGGDMGGDGYGSGGSSGYGSGGYGAGAGAVFAAQDELAEISVEIFGLIYLYNPVSIHSLGTEMLGDKADSAAAIATPNKAAPNATVPINAPNVSPVGSNPDATTNVDQPSAPSAPASEVPVLPSNPPAGGAVGNASN